MNIVSLFPVVTSSTRSNTLDVESYNKVMEFFDDYTYATAPCVTDDFLNIMLIILCRNLTADVKEREAANRIKWGLHMINLIKLEINFRKSDTFTIEKAIDIFHKHFELLKTKGFDINNMLNLHRTNPIGL